MRSVLLITFQVLDQVPSTNLTAHTFVSATASGITRAVLSTGGDYAHTFVTAASNAVSYTPQSTHTFVSADAGCLLYTSPRPRDS